MSNLSGKCRSSFMLGMVFFSLALVGCSEEDTSSLLIEPDSVVNIATTQKNSNDDQPLNKNVDTQPKAEVQEVSGETNKISYSKSELDALAQRYANNVVSVLDVSELTLDGASTLVITFSTPLEQNQDFNSKLTLMSKLRDDKTAKKVDGGWELSPRMTELRMRYLEPDVTLTLNIDDSIKGINGKSLVKEKSNETYTIQTKSIYPSVGFASKGALLPTKIAEGLPIIALNVKSVDVNFFRIKPESLASFVAQWENKTSLSTWEINEYLESTELVYGGRFDLNPRRNTRENLILPLKNIKPLQEVGVYLAVMQESASYSNYTTPVAMFTLSDIGLSVHRSKETLDIFTQALEDGSALKSVKLQLLDNKGSVLAEDVTNKQGHARLSNHSDGKLVLATQNGQTSIIALNRPSLDLSEFNIGGSIGYQTEFFAFGPRDIYRPGETMVVNALVRDADGRQLPTQPVKVDILKPDNKVSHSFVWQPENGLYQYNYTIHDSAPTGDWKMRFNLGDNNPRFYHFKVEDFLPERMALDIATQEAPYLNSVSSINFDITGRYLYGAPAAGNRFQGRALLRPLRNAISSLPGFEFGSVTEKELSTYLDEFDLSLDKQGKATLKINSTWEEIHSPVSVILQASLMESGGRSVVRNSRQAIWPADELPGIRPLFGQKEAYDYSNNSYTKQYSVDEESNAEFELVFANDSGEKLAAQDLTVRLIYERRDYYWRWVDNEGWRSGYDQTDLVYETRKIDIEEGKTEKVSFPVDWGAYRIEFEHPDTGAISSVRFWAGYSWQDNTNNGGGVRPDQVKLKLDKPAYKPGEKIKLSVEAPEAGKGYLLVESSEGPLWWEEISVPAGGAQFDVPINKEWRRHDLYLSALVIRPGDKRLHATPKRAVGLLHIPLSEPERKISLKLETPTKIVPNSTLKVKVKADANIAKKGKKIMALISAVDTGVLNITNFKTPDPYNAFFGRKAYGIDQLDVYGQLIEGRGRLASLRYGGDGDEDAGSLSRGGKKPMTKVLIVSIQSPPVTLNDNGEAEIELSIPDFNGELRIMAQAWTEDDFGHAEEKVTVAAPVIVELGMPRFMAGGDQSRLSLDLHNLSGSWQSFNVNVETNGMLKLITPASQKVTLENGQKTTLSIPITALKGFGSGDIVISTNGIKKEDGTAYSYERKWTLGVRPAYPALIISRFEVLSPQDQLASVKGLVDGLELSTVEAELLLTSTPPLNIAQHIRELHAYPYGCAEQTTSGLFPSLYVSSAQMKTLGIKSDDDETRRKNIERGIERLLTMQRHNGSFGTWSADSDEAPWVSVYITDFLLRAKEQGYSVPETALNRAVERLSYYLQDRDVSINYTQDINYSRFAIQAYSALVLARQQKAPLGQLRQLYDRSNQTISGLPLAQLGIALRLMGDQNRAAEMLQQSLKYPRNSGYNWYGDYGSDIRDEASMLALFNEYALMKEYQPQLVKSLSYNLNNKNYLSTQERNAVFMAGYHLINSSEPEWEAELIKGSISKPVLLADKKTRSYLLNGENLIDIQNVRNIGNSVVYATVNVNGYTETMPALRNNRIEIEREYLDLNGRHIDLDRINSGDLIVAHLKVTTSQERVADALIVDLLPAGFELENQNLANSASLSNNTGNMAKFVQEMQKVTIDYQEYRDDRYVAAIHVERRKPAHILYLARAVTPGTYVVPPPSVESMYQPEINSLGFAPYELTIR